MKNVDSYDRDGKCISSFKGKQILPSKHRALDKYKKKKKNNKNVFTTFNGKQILRQPGLPSSPDRPLIVLANVRIAIGLSVQNIIVNIVIKL